MSLTYICLSPSLTIARDDLSKSEKYQDISKNDLSQSLFERRKQACIERFGASCQVEWNGLPKFIDNEDALNRGITAKEDSDKAWQFFELNKDVFEMKDPHDELIIMTFDRPNSINPYMGYIFTQVEPGYRMANYYCVAFESTGKIKFLKGSFFPEARARIKCDCMSKDQAGAIALSDTTHCKKLSEEEPKIIFKIEKEARCFDDTCSCTKWYIEVMTSLDWGVYNIDCKTGELKFIGYIL